MPRVVLIIRPCRLPRAYLHLVSGIAAPYLALPICARAQMLSTPSGLQAYAEVGSAGRAPDRWLHSRSATRSATACRLSALVRGRPCAPLAPMPLRVHDAV